MTCQTVLEQGVGRCACELGSEVSRVDGLAPAQLTEPLSSRSSRHWVKQGEQLPDPPTRCNVRYSILIMTSTTQTVMTPTRHNPQGPTSLHHPLTVAMCRETTIITLCLRSLHAGLIDSIRPVSHETWEDAEHKWYPLGSQPLSTFVSSAARGASIPPSAAALPTSDHGDDHVALLTRTVLDHTRDRVNHNLTIRTRSDSPARNGGLQHSSPPYD